MVATAFHPSTQGRIPRPRGQPLVHNEFQDSQGYKTIPNQNKQAARTHTVNSLLGLSNATGLEINQLGPKLAGRAMEGHLKLGQREI